jgi:hypothetical protein
LPSANGHFGRLTLAFVLSAMLAAQASAETIAHTASKWGLIGSWSLDCSLPPDRGRGAVLAYETTTAGGVLHRRDFGDKTDENPVIAAKVSSGGMLNLRVFFPAGNQTREYGLLLQPDGGMRAIYNRDEKKQYSIKDGEFTADGKPTPLMHKCVKPVS